MKKTNTYRSCPAFSIEMGTFSRSRTLKKFSTVYSFNSNDISCCTCILYHKKNSVVKQRAICSKKTIRNPGEYLSSYN